MLHKRIKFIPETTVLETLCPLINLMTENRWTIRKNSKAFPESTSLWGCLRTTRVDSDKKVLLGGIIFAETVCKFYGITEDNVCIIIVFY